MIRLRYIEEQGQNKYKKYKDGKEYVSKVFFHDQLACKE